WHFPGYLESYVHTQGFRTTPVGAIHMGDYKLLEFFENGKTELYNLREDISEKRDLSRQMPERVTEMKSKLAAWRADVKAEMPKLKSPAERAADAARKDDVRQGASKKKKKAGDGEP
ncbi:MAG TPA: hypothetical protein VGE76_12530, partial [Opitutaceae bacterium]